MTSALLDGVVESLETASAPAPEVDARALTDEIGARVCRLVRASSSGQGWYGVYHGESQEPEWEAA